MWNSSQSIALSRIATWAIIVLAIVLAVALPIFYQEGYFPGISFIPGGAIEASALEAVTREPFNIATSGTMCFQAEGGILIESSYSFWLLPLYYAFMIPALAILITLDRMLLAIQRGEVFTEGNTRRLRLISWGCFIAAAILALGVIPGAFFCLALAIIAVFFGIILRIVKNLFQAAVELRAENDFTI